MARVKWSVVPSSLEELWLRSPRFCPVDPLGMPDTLVVAGADFCRCSGGEWYTQRVSRGPGRMDPSSSTVERKDPVWTNEAGSGTVRREAHLGIPSLRGVHGAVCVPRSNIFGDARRGA